MGIDRGSVLTLTIALNFIIALSLKLKASSMKSKRVSKEELAKGAEYVAQS